MKKYEPESPEKDRLEFAKGLRELADFIERTEVPLVESYLRYMTKWFNKGEQPNVRKIVRTMGTFEKGEGAHSSGGSIKFRKNFSGGVAYDIEVNKETCCEKVVIAEVNVPPGCKLDEKTGEIYRWDCGEPLLREVSNDS